MYTIIQVEREINKITFQFENLAAMKAFMELSRDVPIVFGLWNGMRYSINYNKPDQCFVRRWPW